jgi:mRNA interferase RelE/StbE
MTDEPWSIGFIPHGRRDLNRLDPQVRRRVYAALERVTEDPRSGQLSRLSGRPEFKLRVGEWRIIVELDHAAHTIVVHRVLPRGRAYDR